MKRKINLCTIYILLWLFGFIQSLFITNSFVSLMFSVPSMLITLYCFVKIFESFRPRGAMLIFGVLFVVLLCYGFGLVFLDNAVRGAGKIKSNSFLLMLMTSLGPVFSFYYFSRKGWLDEQFLTRWFWVFFVAAILRYVDTERHSMEVLMETATKYEDVTNNAAYFILGLFPFVFLLKKKPIIQFVVLGVILYFVVVGVKRGAMLVAAFLLVWFIFVSRQYVSNKRRYFVTFLAVILIVLGWQFIVRFYENSDYFQIRVENTLEGSSSGRNIIYSTLWNHYINNDNMVQLAFGEGAYHTFNIAGNDAHNDWLELLIDCGLFSVIVYFIYWVCFVCDWVKSKHNQLIYSMLGACFIFTFLRSLFSMSFSDMPFFVSVTMGYCFAQIHNNKPYSIE